MDVVLFNVHSIFGERVLTLLLVLGIIYLAATWKAENERPVVGRILAVLIDLQVALGLALYLVLVTAGRAFPSTIFMHALFGILAAGVAHMAAKNPPFLAKLGRFSPVVGFGLALVVMLAAVMIGKSV